MSCHLVTLTIFFMCIYFERERKSMSRGGAEREREKENPKQSPHYQRRAQWGLTELSLTNQEIITWVEIKNGMFNQLSHPGAPVICLLTFVPTWYTKQSNMVDDEHGLLDNAWNLARGWLYFLLFICWPLGKWYCTWF